METVQQHRGEHPDSLRYFGQLNARQVAEWGIAQSPNAQTHFAPGPDGERLAFETQGNPNAKHTILMWQGSPSSRLLTSPHRLSKVTHAMLMEGARIVSVERRGYGLTQKSPLGPRRPEHAPKDALAIADYLGVTSFSVYTRSGGTPYGAMVATELQDMVRSLVMAVPIAPPSGMGKAWFRGMSQRSIKIFNTFFERMENDPEGLFNNLDGYEMLSHYRDLGDLALALCRVPGHNHPMRMEPELQGITPESVVAHSAALGPDLIGLEGWKLDIENLWWWTRYSSAIKEFEGPGYIWAAGQDQSTPPLHAMTLWEHLGGATGDNITLHINGDATHARGVDFTGWLLLKCMDLADNGPDRKKLIFA